MTTYSSWEVAQRLSPDMPVDANAEASVRYIALWDGIHWEKKSDSGTIFFSKANANKVLRLFKNMHTSIQLYT